MLDLATEISEEAKIDFSVETLNLSVFTTDRNSIEKILFNLISNAFKYTPNRGCIKAHLTQTEDELIFTIKNSGNGLTTKPFHPRHIVITIQNLIRKQSQLKNYYRSGLSMITVREGVQLHQEDESILTYIEKHLDDEALNPNNIADALGISKTSLYRKMEELIQKTPSEFVRNIRLNHASLLLKSTKMTVQEIMFKSGFTNKSYFYREFAKQFNASPNKYRQNQE